MKRIEANRRLYRIYRILRDDNFDVRVALSRKLPRNKQGRQWFGMVDPQADGGLQIVLNPWRPWKSRGGFVSTVLHECLHLSDWDESEKEISRIEKEMFKALTDRQLGNLMKRVFTLVKGKG